MFDQIVPSIVKAGVGHVGDIVLSNRPPKIENVMLGGIPPEYIATISPAKELLTGDMYVDNSPSHYIKAEPNNGWADECRIRFTLTNESSRSLRIVGILANQTPCSIRPSSSVLFPTQGTPTGDGLRFECRLDKGQPSMRRFDLVNFERRYRSEEYYFDEGFIEVNANETVFFSIVFVAKENAYRIQPEIVYTAGKRTYSIEIPLARDVFVYPLKDIPESGLFRKSFSSEPPYITEMNTF